MDSTGLDTPTQLPPRTQAQSQMSLDSSDFESFDLTYGNHDEDTPDYLQFLCEYPTDLPPSYDKNSPIHSGSQRALLTPLPSLQELRTMHSDIDSRCNDTSSDSIFPSRNGAEININDESLCLPYLALRLILLEYLLLSPSTSGGHDGIRPNLICRQFGKLLMRGYGN